MMLLHGLNYRVATAIRLAGLALICWSVAGSRHAPAGAGRGLVVTVLLAACVVCWLAWTIQPDGASRAKTTLDLYGLVS
jgi:hypothetical protein